MAKRPKKPQPSERRVRLIRKGRSQVVANSMVPELPGNEAILRQEGGRLVIEPAARRSNLLRALAQLSPTDDVLPDIDPGLVPLDDVSR